MWVLHSGKRRRKGGGDGVKKERGMTGVSGSGSSALAGLLLPLRLWGKKRGGRHLRKGRKKKGGDELIYLNTTTLSSITIEILFLSNEN